MAIDKEDYGPKSWAAGSILKASDLTDMSNTLNRVEEFLRVKLGENGEVYAIIAETAKKEVATIIGTAPESLNTLEEIVKVFEDHKVEFTDLHHIVIKHENDIDVLKKEIEKTNATVVLKADASDLEAFKESFESYKSAIEEKLHTYANKVEVENALDEKLDVATFDSFNGEFIIFKSGVTSAIGTMVTRDEFNRKTKENADKIQANTEMIAQRAVATEVEAQFKAHEEEYFAIIDEKATKVALADLEATVAQLDESTQATVKDLEATDEAIDGRVKVIEEVLPTKAVATEVEAQFEAHEEAFQAKIDLKSDITTVDALTKKFNDFEMSTSLALESKATSAELAEMAITLNDKIDENEEKIEANVAELAKKAVATEVDAKFEEHIEEFQAKVDSKVAQVAYDAKVAELEEAIAKNADDILENAEGISHNVEELAKKAVASVIEGQFEEYGVKVDSKVDQAAYDEKIAYIEAVLEDNSNNIVTNGEALLAHEEAFQAKIDAKVAQSDYDAKVVELEARLTKNEGDILTNAEGIAKNVTDIAERAVASVIDAQFEAHEAEYGNRIEAKAEKTYVDAELASKVDLDAYEADKATFAVKEAVNAKFEEVLGLVSANEDAIKANVNAITQRVVQEQFDEHIEEFQDKIDLKADKTEVETLNGYLTQFEASVTTALGAKASVNDLATLQVTLNDKIEANEDKIQENVIEIAKRAVATEVDAQFEAHIEEFQGKIDAKVAQVDYDAKVVELEARIASNEENIVENAEGIAKNVEELAKKAVASVIEGQFEEYGVKVNAKADKTALEALSENVESELSTKATVDALTEAKAELEGKISTKVETEAYNAKVAEIEQSVKVNADAIAKNAEDIANLVVIETVKAEVESAIKTHEEAFQAKIAVKVAQSDYEAKVASLESSIKANADAVETKAEVEYVDAKLAERVAVSAYEEDKKTFAVAETVEAELEAIRELVDANELAIATNVELIATKANASDVNARFEEHEETFEGKISLKADATKVIALEGRIQQFETSTLTALEAKASTTELTNVYVTLNDKIDDNEEKIEANVVEIAKRAVATEVDAQFDAHIEEFQGKIDAKLAISDYESDKTVLDSKLEVLEGLITGNTEQIEVNIGNITERVVQTQFDEHVEGFEAHIEEFQGKIDLKADKSSVESKFAEIEALVGGNAESIEANVKAIAERAVATEVEAQFKAHEEAYQAKIDAKVAQSDFDAQVQAYNETIATLAKSDDVASQIKTATEELDGKVTATLQGYAKLDDLPTAEDFAEEFASAESLALYEERVEVLETKGFLTETEVSEMIEEAKPDLTPYAFKADVDLELATKATVDSVAKCITREEVETQYATNEDVAVLGEELGEYEIANNIVIDGLKAEIESLKKLIIELQSKHEDVVSIEPVEEVLSSNTSMNVGGDLKVESVGIVYGSKDAESKIIPIALTSTRGNVSVEGAQLDSVVMNIVAGEAE